MDSWVFVQKCEWGTNPLEFKHGFQFLLLACYPLHHPLVILGVLDNQLNVKPTVALTVHNLLSLIRELCLLDIEQCFLNQFSVIANLLLSCVCVCVCVNLFKLSG